MKVVIDTCVWSAALRRNAPKPGWPVATFRELVRLGQVQMLGVMRQEIHSGVPEERQFRALLSYLRSFEDLPLESADYELAAEFFNVCRRHGVQGAHADFLICAACHRRDLPLLTTDHDFDHYARHLPLRLLRPTEP